MDGNSVITQVARPTANDDLDANNNDPSHPFRNALTTIKQKRPKKRNIFKSLFCCFTSNHNSTNSNYSNDNNNNNTKTSDNSTLIQDLTSTQYPDQVTSYSQNSDKALLPQLRSTDSGRKCLIIDLDETLVHSSFKPVINADFIVPVEIEGITHQVYVLKRPYVDEFLQKMGQLFECVLFTASLAKYADPVADLLDKHDVFRARLFREACVYYRGNYVKDLSKLGRDLNSVIICDNSPASYIFHPDNAVPVTSWFDDMHDTELLELIPFLERLSTVDNVYSVLRQSGSNGSLNETSITTNNIYIQQKSQQNDDSFATIANNSPITQVQQPSQIEQQEQHKLLQMQKISINKNFINIESNNNSNLSTTNSSSEGSYTINENSIIIQMENSKKNNSKQQQQQKTLKVDMSVEQ